MSDTAATIAGVLFATIVVFLMTLIMAFPIKWLWNWVVVSIFSLRQVTLMEAWGLFTLCCLLFKNMSWGKTSS